MTPEENLRAVIEAITQLDPAAVRDERDVMTGARVVAWEAKGALARSSDHALPLPDHVDRWVDRNWRHYEIALEKMRAAGDLALVCQRALLSRLTLAEAQQLIEDETSNSATCANCGAVVVRTAHVRLRRGRCRNCYEYLLEHDVDRPRDLWESAIQ